MLTYDIQALRRGAAAGEARAQRELAELLLIGRERSFDPNEAMHLLNAACAQRYSPALLFHAALALRGFGRPQNFDDAFKLLSDAVSAGDTNAKGQLMVLGGKIDQEAWAQPAAIVQHHDAPRIYTIKNFLPKPICNWLIKSARKNLQPAVVWGADGAPAKSAGRSNSVARTGSLEPDLVLQLANMRIALATGVPIVHQEGTQILHYARGEQYGRHFDFIFPDQPGTQRELQLLGQRVFTFLIYLNDDFEGGETEFPLLNWRFRGEAGDAVMWWNVAQSGAPEQNSLHAGLPVTKGEKWLASVWMRQRPVPLNITS